MTAYCRRVEFSVGHCRMLSGAARPYTERRSVSGATCKPSPACRPPERPLLFRVNTPCSAGGMTFGKTRDLLGCCALMQSPPDGTREARSPAQQPVISRGNTRPSSKNAARFLDEKRYKRPRAVPFRSVPSLYRNCPCTVVRTAEIRTVSFGFASICSQRGTCTKRRNPATKYTFSLKPRFCKSAGSGPRGRRFKSCRPD